MIFILIASAFAEVCDDPVDVQDLNCNNVPVAREPSVDLTDPVCLANINPGTLAPYANADYYYDYTSFGCSYLIDGYDVADSDGLSYAELSFGGPPPDLAVILKCDNCPS